MHSLYENLPVYKKSKDLVVYFENIVRNFDRYHRYMIGSELRTMSHQVLVLVSQANTKAVRAERLKEAIDILEKLKIKIQVCREIEALKPFKHFEFSSKSVIELLKQCEGWLGSQNSSRPSS